MGRRTWTAAVLAASALVGCRALLSIDEKVLVDESGGAADDAAAPDASDARADAARPRVFTLTDAGHLGRKWVVSTFVGMAGVADASDGTGMGALLQSPWGLAVAGSQLYVQSWPGVTRDVDLTTAMTTTIANEGAYAGSIVLGSALYIANYYNNCIVRLDLGTRQFGVLAGSGVTTANGGQGCGDGTGASARFDWPYGIATDGAYLYVTDTCATIRRIDPTTAKVTTLTGSPFSIGAENGTLSEARFYYPVAITYAEGKLYVTDTGNHDIRAIDLASATVSTLAGSGAQGSDDGVGTAATFHWPYGIAPDGAGSLYVTDNNADVVRRITIATGAVTTIAGHAYDHGSDDGPGPDARFSGLQGITVDGDGNVYVSEYANHTVRKLSRE